MGDCFSRIETSEIISQFNDIVAIQRHRYQRKNQRNACYGNRKILKAQVYEIDGVEYTEIVHRKEKRSSLRDLYEQGDIEVAEKPFTQEEFADYLRQDDNKDRLELLNGASRFLVAIGTVSRRDAIRGSVADLVIDSIIIERMLSNQDDSARRAYAYYKQLVNTSAT